MSIYLMSLEISLRIFSNLNPNSVQFFLTLRQKVKEINLLKNEKLILFDTIISISELLDQNNVNPMIKLDILPSKLSFKQISFQLKQKTVIAVKMAK